MAYVGCNHTDAQESNALRSCLGCGQTEYHTSSFENQTTHPGDSSTYSGLSLLQTVHTIRLLQI